MSAWRSLGEALDRQAAEGRTPTFWLRDDDAAKVTQPLERLAGLVRDAEVPAVLAVVPALADPALAGWMRGQRGMRAAAHGFAHANHAPSGEKPQELGPHRPLKTMRKELETAHARVMALFGEHALPMLVPPWNRIALPLVPVLPPLGFRYLSLFGPIDPRLRTADLVVVNCHVDIIDWRGTRLCRPHEEIVGEIVGLLRGPLVPDREPIGILTHHLVHDEAAWSFLARLFETTVARAEWVAPA